MKHHATRSPTGFESDELRYRTAGAMAAAAGLNRMANPYRWVLEADWSDPESLDLAVVICLWSWWAGYDSAVLAPTVPSRPPREW